MHREGGKEKKVFGNEPSYHSMSRLREEETNRKLARPKRLRSAAFKTLARMKQQRSAADWRRTGLQAAICPVPGVCIQLRKKEMKGKSVARASLGSEG